MAKKWYVVHTYSGSENKVKEAIEASVRAEGLEDKVAQILIPTEDVVEIRDGRRSVSSQKIFPSYIIIEMEFDDDTWALVKNTHGVTGFVGPGRTPVALTEEEVQNIMSHMTQPKIAPSGLYSRWAKRSKSSMVHFSISPAMLRKSTKNVVA